MRGASTCDCNAPYDPCSSAMTRGRHTLGRQASVLPYQHAAVCRLSSFVSVLLVTNRINQQLGNTTHPCCRLPVEHADQMMFSAGAQGHRPCHPRGQPTTVVQSFVVLRYYTTTNMWSHVGLKVATSAIACCSANLCAFRPRACREAVRELIDRSCCSQVPFRTHDTN